MSCSPAASRRRPPYATAQLLFAEGHPQLNEIVWTRRRLPVRFGHDDLHDLVALALLGIAAVADAHEAVAVLCEEERSASLPGLPPFYARCPGRSRTAGRDQPPLSRVGNGCLGSLGRSRSNRRRPHSRPSIGSRGRSWEVTFGCPCSGERCRERFRQASPIESKKGSAPGYPAATPGRWLRRRFQNSRPSGTRSPARRASAMASRQRLAGQRG